MDNPDRLATLDTQGIPGRHTKSKKKQTNKQKKKTTTQKTKKDD